MISEVEQKHIELLNRKCAKEGKTQNVFRLMCQIESREEARDEFG